MTAGVSLIAFGAGCGGGVVDASHPGEPVAPPPIDPQSTSGEDTGPDALSISTRELGDWTETIAALQADVNGQGRTVHIMATHGGGTPLPCDAYSIVLPAPANAAFEVGHCESGATALKLVHRSALFAHDGPLPRPLEVGIVAREVRSTTITSGPPPKPIDVICGIALKPSVVNMETGVRVSLLPDRYTLHVRAEGGVADVDVAPTSDGWQVHGGRALAVDYDVTDTVTGTMIVQDHANLTCGEGALDAEARAEMPFGPADPNARRTSRVGGPCPEEQLQLLLAEKHRLETGEPAEVPHLSASCVGDWSSRSSSTTKTIAPEAPPNEAAYVATSIFGWTLVGGSVAMVAGGIASLVESGNTSTTPSTHPPTAKSVASEASSRGSLSTRGVILIDIAPHVLTTGIVTLAMNGAANRRAKARAASALSWQPFVAPVSGGAFAGVGHSF